MLSYYHVDVRNRPGALFSVKTTLIRNKRPLLKQEYQKTARHSKRPPPSMFSAKRPGVELASRDIIIRGQITTRFHDVLPVWK